MPIITLAPRRSMNCSPYSGFFPYARSVAPRFPAPIFRSLEDDLSTFFNDVDKVFSGNKSVRSYQPRFDVREEKDAYHLHGELPGVNSENLQVEFVDRNTMVVRGRTVRESQRGNAPKAVEGDKEPDTTMSGALSATANADAMETESTATTTQADRPSTPDSTSSNYHKATVEDDSEDFVDVRSETAGAEEANTESAQPQESEKASAPAEKQQQQPAKPAQSDSHYWVSERSVGEFNRSFRFPGQIDQDNVKASLKDGVLSVVVPKVAEQGPRRITVQ